LFLNTPRGKYCTLKKSTFFPPYLGHIIRNDPSDEDDVQRGNVANWKKLECKFPIQMLKQTYLETTVLYCSYSKANMLKIHVAFNYLFRMSHMIVTSHVPTFHAVYKCKCGLTSYHKGFN